MSLVETLTSFVEQSVNINRAGVPFCETPAVEADPGSVKAAQKIVGTAEPPANAALVAKNSDRPALITSHPNSDHVIIRHTPSLTDRQISELRTANTPVFHFSHNGQR